MSGERLGDHDIVAMEEIISHAVSVLRAGGVVAIPTDTVYGLAAALDIPPAVERLFSIKGRISSQAIPVLVGSKDDLRELSDGITGTALTLAESCWPGGLTIVVSASPAVPTSVTRGGTTVGLRMPDNAVALEIIKGVGGALAVTSANRSGDTEATRADEVRDSLGELVDFIVDGGPTPGNRPSTVVDATRERARVLRQGVISREQLEQYLDGPVI